MNKDFFRLTGHPKQKQSDGVELLSQFRVGLNLAVVIARHLEEFAGPFVLYY